MGTGTSSSRRGACSQSPGCSSVSGCCEQSEPTTTAGAAPWPPEAVATAGPAQSTRARTSNVSGARTRTCLTPPLRSGHGRTPPAASVTIPRGARRPGAPPRPRAGGDRPQRRDARSSVRYVRCVSFPEPGAVWRPAATTERAVTSPTGSWTRFAAPGTEVGGGFGLFESWIPADSPGALPHLHTGFTESFYVLDGALRIMTGETWTEAGPGDLVHVPHRGVHAFRTGPDSDARFLILFVPGAPRERYFRGLAEFAARATPPSPEEVDAFALTCDQVNLRDHPGF
ncbi:hypothetical protein DMP14_08090 [Pseudonocardia sp. Ae707_Ps2]